MIRRVMSRLAMTTILAMAASVPALAQETPAFRVPVGGQQNPTTVEPVYAWLQQVGTCSTTCGTGTRATTYQCQNVVDYDHAGIGYGLPEPDAACTASVGPRPDDDSASCTVYSGCGYDWVKPAIAQKAIPLDGRPVGRLGCGLVNQRFSPYCQRTGGGTNVVMSSGDHRFCSSDRPDYDQVASGDADALGYDRDVTQISACAPRDHDWTKSEFGSWSSDCSTTATRSRIVTCERRFDGAKFASSAEEDAACGTSRPASTETAARYGSCSYSYDYSTWTDWSSDCDTDAVRTRTAQCRRSNDGGQDVPASECSDRGVARETVSETTARYASCSYEFRTGAWSAYSSDCSAASERTRDVWCERSNGDRVDDSECTAKGSSRPQSRETSARYGSCSHSWSEGGFGSWSSSCSGNAVRTQSVTCRRDLDGATVDDALCSGTRPASSQSAAQYAGCRYASGGSPSAWSAWSSGCSASATRTRSYQCIRDNDGGEIVAASECTGRGIELAESQSAPNYASCTYHIEDAGTGACNGTNRPHYWRCVRDADGAQVDSQTFCGRANPTYDACSFTYTLGDAGVGACQSSNQAPHYWNCRRNETGEMVDSGTYCGRASTTYDACTYQWTFEAVNWSGMAACVNGQQTENAQCRRNDGSIVASSECTNRGIEVTRTQTCEPDQGYGTCTGGTSIGGVQYDSTPYNGGYYQRTGSYPYPGGGTYFSFEHMYQWCRSQGGSCIQSGHYVVAPGPEPTSPAWTRSTMECQVGNVTYTTMQPTCDEDTGECSYPAMSYYKVK